MKKHGRRLKFVSIKLIYVDAKQRSLLFDVKFKQMVLSILL